MAGRTLGRALPPAGDLMAGTSPAGAPALPGHSIAGQFWMVTVVTSEAMVTA